VLKSILYVLFLISFSLSSQEKPNIIYILADDLGYGDLGCYGSELNKTPHLDKLSKQGVRFTSFYAAAWCMPSRIALMTGNYPNRPELMKKDSQRLADCITIPEMLKEKGYTSALIGKWHMGMGKGTHPLDQGFDYWYGTKGSNDWDGPKPNYNGFKNAPEEAWKTPLYINREKKGIIPQSEMTGRYTSETLKFIKENKDKPFFIYLSHNMPHVPVFASEKFKGKSKNGIYGDVIEELDWSVGEVVKALSENGLLEKTMIVFTSDNGPWSMFKEFGGTSGSLRGEKSTTWEGGVRVPTIFYYPEKFKPAVNDAFVVNSDVYATVASLIGIKVKYGQAIDTLDISKVLLSGEPSPRQKHIYYFRTPMAYRKGDYKIHFFSIERTRDPITGKKEAPIKYETPLLFNLKKDPGETTNIADKYPELVDELSQEFKEVQTKIKNWQRLD